MRVFLTVAMVLVTIHAISVIAENGRATNVNDVPVTRHLTGAGCFAVALAAVALDLSFLYLLAFVV